MTQFQVCIEQRIQDQSRPNIHCHKTETSLAFEVTVFCLNNCYDAEGYKIYQTQKEKLALIVFIHQRVNTSFKKGSKSINQCHHPN